MTGFYYMVCYDCCKTYPSKYRYCPQCGAKLYRWDTNGGGGTFARAMEVERWQSTLSAPK